MAKRQETNSTEEIRKLRAQLQAGQFSPVYLVTGDQDYLRTQNRDLIRNALVPGGDTMNSAYFTGDQFTVQEIMDLAETLPFFAERRVITIEESGFFDKKAAAADPLVEYLARIPETTHIVFVERKVDRTRRLFKAVKKAGTILDCTTPGAGDLRKWILARVKAADMGITDGAADLLIEYTDGDLLTLKNEIDKLTAYCMGREGIAEQDVRAMCTPKVGDWIFDLIAAITGHETDKALGIYLALLGNQVPPQVILALLIRNYNQLLQVGELEARGMNAEAIADATGYNSWVIKNRIRSALRGNTVAGLTHALQDCVQLDQDYKSGRINDQLGVETLIVRNASRA